MKTPLERLREMRKQTPAEVRGHNERAREEIDTYFSGPIMAGLTRLHAEGKLPTLAIPEWEPVDREWERASEDSPLPCDVGRVKRLMRAFIEARGGTVEPGNRDKTTN